MKKRCFIFIPLIIISLLFIGCSTNNSASEYKTYKNKDISFIYPSSWIKVDPKKLDINPTPVFFLASPDEEDNANINLTVSESPLLAPSAEEQVEDLVHHYEMFGKSYGIKEYKKISFKKLKIGEFNAGILAGELTFSQVDLTVLNAQLIIPIGSKTYCLTATCKKDKWEKYSPVFREILASVKLVDN
jgi:hypothetical protein